MVIDDPDVTTQITFFLFPIEIQVCEIRPMSPPAVRAPAVRKALRIVGTRDCQQQGMGAGIPARDLVRRAHSRPVSNHEFLQDLSCRVEVARRIERINAKGTPEAHQ